MGKQDKNKKQVESQRFQYKFTPVMIVLCVAAILLSLAGIGVSVWRIVQFRIHSFNDVIKYPFLIAVCVFCIVFVLWVFFKSQYLVDGENLTTQFAFVKTAYPIAKMTAITFDRTANKLTINFGEDYITLAVDPAWCDQLVRAILDVNDAIDYSFTLTEIKK